MSQPENLDTPLTRRSWLVLAASAVTGCGGGSVSMASLPGTGGTGLFAQGPISGFGSVILNGIRFDDTAATVQLDGLAAGSSDLRLGMVASVQGQRGADVTLGTASSIEVWSIAQGQVTQGQATPGASGRFSVAGMTVLTDPNTVFDGFSATAPLSVGQRVAVWGLQAGADGRSWSATRVALVADSAVVSSGMLSVEDSQRTLNGLLLTGALAGTLAQGALVRVQGTLSANGSSLEVLSAKPLSGSGGASPQGDAEIEGVITTAPSASGFSLGTIVVDASQAVYSPANAQLFIGARVEVNGTWRSGVLQATSVALQDEQAQQTLEISGSVETFSSLSNFTVRGQRCDASGLTSFGHGTAADLKVGAKVKLKGSMAGEVLRVTELEFSV
ncbi:MAG: DUF5666 domain-containing protein [Rhodoferax sp.]|uniref:DUF5666 domain-containing protein n=1 Tax=Rhodoferax sp. TaxID=50421 RepID=UPI00263295A5|nr:DUF5666 domain-containing protein [Rhodoferax sp.]MDD5332693.1 DUF5666 domain-containing protein [Rhodoferax sp.]